MQKQNTRGQTAEGPTEIPTRGWKDIFWRLKDQIFADHISVVAAGVAFFGLLAIFPAIAAMISLAGYLLDPSDIATQLQSALSVLPEDAASIVQDQVSTVVGGSDTASGLGAIFGLAIALYGATKGMMTLMEGMNIAYDEREQRGFIALYATGVALTLFLIFGLLVTFAVTLIVPPVVEFIGLPQGTSDLIVYLQWPLLACLTIFGLAVIYRYGPSRSSAQWRWVTPGAIIATFIWIVGTLAFTAYAQNFGSYNETYGTLGGVIVLLTWLWLSAFIVLLGAELNSEMEHQTRRDSTVGPAKPEGQRGAVKADTQPAGLAARGAPSEAPSTGSRAGPRRALVSEGREIGRAIRRQPISATALAALVAIGVLRSLKRPE